MKLPDCLRCGQPRARDQLGRNGWCESCRAPVRHCTVPKCRKPVKARQMCENHYRAWRTHGDPYHTREDQPRKKCGAKGGCDRFARAGGLCATHYAQQRRTGTTHQIRKAYGGKAKPRRMRPSELAAEVEWLLGTDSTDRIAARLGRDREGLYSTLRRAGRQDLVDRLATQTALTADLMRESRMGQVFGPDPRKAHGRAA